MSLPPTNLRLTPAPIRLPRTPPRQGRPDMPTVRQTPNRLTRLSNDKKKSNVNYRLLTASAWRLPVAVLVLGLAFASAVGSPQTLGVFVAGLMTGAAIGLGAFILAGQGAAAS